MKNVFKRSLSVLLAITIIFSSAYVGLGEIDFGKMGTFLKNLAPDFSVKSQAANVVNSGSCGANVTWTLDEEGLLTISGTGTMANYSFSSVPWYSPRSSIKSIVISDSVTSIGYYAFSGCTNLTSITIPDSVTSIGNAAFYGCSSLTEIIIPNNVTSINNSVFYDCTNLTSITIPNSITSIGDYVFGSCTNLTSITIPNSVTSIGEAAFYGCTNLTSITIPNSVTSMGGGVFRDCFSLRDVVLSNCLNKIPVQNTLSGNSYGFFEGCKSLISVTIPDSVKIIGTGTFKGCNPKILANKGSYAETYANNNSIFFVPLDGDESEITISGSYGNVNWHIDKMFGILTISCDGDMPGYSSTEVFPWKDYSVLVEQVIIKDATTISKLAFQGFTRLVSVVFPDGVKSIGDYAFKDCTSLKLITIPDSVTSIGNNAFSGCTNLTSIAIPDNVTSIGNNAFKDCTSLKLITIPDSVTSIGNNAFSGCDSLTAIEVSKSNQYYKSVDGVLFYNDKTELVKYPIGKTSSSYIIPDSVMSIGESAFSSCLNLTSIIISDSVTSIGNNAFSGCTNLTSITIPDNVTSIGNNAFSGCTNLTSITIPDNVTNIGVFAFEGCSSLAFINISDNVTNIGNSIFSGCTNLTSVTIPNSVTSIGSNAFQGCTSITSVTIPNSVTSIGSNAFQGCSSLTVITIPDSVTSIGNSTFYNCSSLTEITIPDSVTNIGMSAFWGCSSLTSINIPDNVINIGDYAFRSCINLADITIPNSVTSIGAWTFHGCTTLASINVSENNLYYFSDDGILFNKDKTILIKYPEGNTNISYTIPNSVTSIDNRAFSDCTNLISITIPESVTNINGNAFENCSSLEFVDIDVSNVTFGEKIFSNSLIYNNINNWCPEGFMLNGEIFEYNPEGYPKVILNNIIQNYLAPIYDNGLYTKDENELAILSQCVEELTAGVETDYEKIEVISNYIAKNIYYDEDCYNGRKEDTFSAPYDVFVNSSALCNGYAKLTKELLTIAGITGYYILGYNHAYNIAYDSDNKKWIYIDNTWSDGSDNSYYFDFPIEVLGTLNHEICDDLVVYVDNVKYSLVLPNISSDKWFDMSKWYFRLEEVPTGTEKFVVPDNIRGIDVRSIGNNAFEGCTSLTSVTIPNSVTSIGKNVFKGCTSLTSITIPNSVTNISMSAFYGCTNLTSITIPESVTSIGDYAFYNCDSLTSITIPDSVTSIGFSAFRSCTNLTSITIPDSVTSIGYSAFLDSSNLEAVYITDIAAWCGINFVNYSSNPLYYADNLYLNRELVTDLVIPDGVTSIGSNAFCYFTNLASITIPDSVTNIGENVFRNCRSLRVFGNKGSYVEAYANNNDLFFIPLDGSESEIIVSDTYGKVEWTFDKISGLLTISCEGDMPIYDSDEDLPWMIYSDFVDKVVIKNATSISPYTFMYMSYIKSVIISDSVTNIGEEAFSGCTNLNSITIPDSVTNIGDNAFDGCTSLASINVSENNLYYVAVDGVLFNKDKTTLLQYPAGKLEIEYTIPDGVTSIGSKAFNGCTSLTLITIPDSVTSIGYIAFDGCSSLVSINVSENNLYYFSVNGILFNKDKTTLIKYPAGKLEVEYTILDGVTSVDDDAFLDCTSLTTITIPNSVTSISYSAFRGCTSLKQLKVYNDNLNISNLNLTSNVEICANEGSQAHQFALDNGNVFIAHIHNLIKSETVSSTCVEQGYTIYICTECKVEHKDDFVDVIGHTFTDEWIIESQSTCNLHGKKYRICTGCKDKFYEVLPLAEHIASDWVTNKKATCTTTGEKHRECTVCGIILETEEIVATGHNYLSEWTIDVKATCTEAGSKSHHCLECDFKTDVTVIQATGHNYSSWHVILEPTCTEEGSQSKTCSACGAVGETEAIAAFGHNYLTEWSIDKEATCTEEGSKSHHCSRCDEKADVTVITAIGHSYGDWVVVSKPTCTKYGSRGKFCLHCNDVISEMIPASGHTYFDEWTIDIEATCTEEGSKSHHCLNCDSKKDVTVISATGHNSSDWITDKEATVYAEGSKHKECTVCGEIIETAEIPQLKAAKPKLKSIENTDYGVKITWGKVSGADSYRVYRKTSKSDWKYLGSTSKTGYTDKSAKSGTKYYYAVRARNEAGNSSLSSSLSKYYLVDPTLKTPKSTKSGVALEWNKISGSDGYMVYRKTGSGSYKKIATVKGYKKVKYTDKSAKKGKTYTYKVKAYKSKTYSAYSNAKKIKDKY